MADKTVAVRLVAQVGQYVSGMGQATAATAGFQGATAGATGAAGGLAGTVRKFTPLLAAGGGLAYAFKETAGEAIAWESAFAGVRKTVDASEGEFAALSSGLRDLSTEIPTAATELAAVGEAAGQLGIQTENILGFTRTMADLGETTNMAAQEAATQLARMANITGMAQEDFDRLGSTIVDLGNNFATTEAEIVEMGLRIAGAGEQVGMTEGEILGLATALSSVGIEAQAGGTAISRVMVDIANEVASAGDKLEGFAQVAGMSAQQFTDAWQEDPAQALASFIEGLRGISEAGGNVFQILEDLELADIRVRDALLRAANAGGLLSDAIETGNDAWSENVALVEEANKRYETTEARLDIARNKITDLKTTIGESLLPAIGQSADAFLGLFDIIEAGAEGDASGVERGINLLAGALPGFNIVAEEANKKAGDAAGGVAELTSELSESDQAAMGAVDSFLTLGEGLDDTADSYDDVAGAADDATAATASSAEEAMKVADPIFALFDAWRDYEDAVIEADEAIAKHGATSHEAVQAGQDLAIALMELQHAADDGVENWSTFEKTLATWVEQGRITEEQAYSIMHGVDHARESAQEFSGDYDATLGLEGGDEVLRQLHEVGMVAEAVAGTYTVRVNAETPRLAGNIPVGAGPVTRSSPPPAGGSGYVTGGGGGGIPRAAGGPVWPNGRFLLGERGVPEMLDLGPGGFGRVTPMPHLATPQASDAGPRIGRQMDVHEGAIQIFTKDAQRGAFEATHQLRRLEVELSGG